MSRRLGRDQFARLRETPRYHWLVVVGACLVGLVAATLHWLGLVLGGALVGLFAASLRRALLAGLGFGVLVLAVWGGLFGLSGTFGAATATGEFAWLAVAMGLGLALLGSLVRGIV
ncbi:MAG: hypothetical protein V5A55_03735 [Halovenus sp.]